jgi:hypothetical protein
VSAAISETVSKKGVRSVEPTEPENISETVSKKGVRSVEPTEPENVSETVSKKAGRPRLFDIEHEALLASLIGKPHTPRTRRNVYHAGEAHLLLKRFPSLYEALRDRGRVMTQIGLTIADARRGGGSEEDRDLRAYLWGYYVACEAAALIAEDPVFATTAQLESCARAWRRWLWNGQNDDGEPYEITQDWLRDALAKWPEVISETVSENGEDSK